jgi:hypothetical protein
MMLTLVFDDYDPSCFDCEVHNAPAFCTELVHDLPGQGYGLGHQVSLWE